MKSLHLRCAVFFTIYASVVLFYYFNVKLPYKMHRLKRENQQTRLVSFEDLNRILQSEDKKMQWLSPNEIAFLKEVFKKTSANEIVVDEEVGLALFERAIKIFDQ